MRNLNVSSALVVVATLSACNGGGQVSSSKYVKSQLVIASQGGTVTVAAAESPVLAGTQVVIPPNALSADTVINIGFGGGVATESSETPVSGLLIATGGQQAGPLVYFGPDRTAFSLPVTVTVPFTPNPAASQGRLVVDALESGGTSFEIASSALVVSASTLTFSANGFTQFGADYLPPLPDAGTGCDGGLTLCGGSCTDTTSDSQNCGACGVRCTGGVCQSSSCVDAGSDGGGCTPGQTVQPDAGCCWGANGNGPCGTDGTTGNADCCEGLVCLGNVCIFPDAGSGTPDAGCFANQTACVYNTDCCSGNCSGNAASGAFCAPVPDAGVTCFAVGATCYGDLDCCTQYCVGWDAGNGGSCADPTVAGCTPNGATCTGSQDCCSGDCGVLADGGPGCVESESNCRHEAFGCNLNSECCTGYCDPSIGSGKCYAGPYCLHTRANCNVDSDCCSGWCVAGTGSQNQCADPLGTGTACTEDMLACRQNSDCCTGVCDGLQPPDTLVGYCGNGNGSVCSGNDVVCSQSSDCCTGNCAVVDAGQVCQPTAGCAADYASCTVDTDCCDGFCSPVGQGGSRVCVPLCGNTGRGAGAFCSQNSDCCGYACSADGGTGGGTCELYCSLYGQSCFDDTQCCIGLCSIGLVNSTYTCIGTLADAGERCHWDNQSCGRNSDCCSGTCATSSTGALPDGGAIPDGGGLCTESFFGGGDGGYLTQACLSENSFWDGVTGGCCAGSALVLSDGGFVCLGEVCLTENATCYNDLDCCSQYCQGWDAGTGGTCLPQSMAQCAFGGWECSLDTDCCSGACILPDAGVSDGGDGGDDAGFAYPICAPTPECLSDPSPCYQNYDCCGGLCVNVGDAGLICQTPDGG